MKHIREIIVKVIEEDEEGIIETDISSPTFEMVEEKYGAWERSRGYLLEGKKLETQNE